MFVFPVKRLNKPVSSILSVASTCLLCCLKWCVQTCMYWHRGTYSVNNPKAQGYTFVCILLSWSIYKLKRMWRHPEPDWKPITEKSYRGVMSSRLRVSRWAQILFFSSLHHTRLTQPYVDCAPLCRPTSTSCSGQYPVSEPLVSQAMNGIEWKSSYMSLIDRIGISPADKLYYLKKYYMLVAQLVNAEKAPSSEMMKKLTKVPGKKLDQR